MKRAGMYTFYFDRSKSMKFKSSDKIYSKYYISVLITDPIKNIFEK